MAASKSLSITTTEILKELKKAGGDNTELFYLYISTTSDNLIDRLEKLLAASKNEQQAPTAPENQYYTDPNVMQLVEKLLAALTTKENEQQAPTANRKVMNKFHKELPELLAPEGWRKVVDKDTDPTYRALYFNKIPKNDGETDIDYIMRVNGIRERIDAWVRGKQVETNTSFKINSLLSKPFVYDKAVLLELLELAEGRKQLATSSPTS